MRQGCCVIQSIPEDPEFTSIIPVESIISTHPNEPVMVLEHTTDGIIGKSL
jgi:hypothetical protein